MVVNALGYWRPLARRPVIPAHGSGLRPARGQAPAGIQGTYGSRPAPGRQKGRRAFAIWRLSPCGIRYQMFDPY